LFYQGKIGVAAKKFQCDLHAYVLMPNHLHLLLTPHLDAGISKLMQYEGRYYVQYFNRRHDRTGSLWEGRYRATLLDPKTYLLPVCHYVEANPVRAGLVEQVSDYAWSSYDANATGSEDPLITHHPVYERLGRGASARHASDASTGASSLDDALLKEIRDATNKAWLLGDDQFCQEIGVRLNRRALPRSRGGDRRSAAYRRAAGSG
jgi:putative transposase